MNLQSSTLASQKGVVDSIICLSFLLLHLRSSIAVTKLDFLMTYFWSAPWRV